MKKVIAILLTGIILLSAVEWNVEQITANPDIWCTNPILKLDGASRAMILYAEFGEQSLLKVAVDDTDGWWIREVAEVLDPMYSFDCKADGSILIAYSDWTGLDESDLFLASDSTGEFVSTNITDDLKIQLAPVLKLNQSGEPRFIYAAAEDPDSLVELRYGWVSPEGLMSELVTDNMYQDDYVGYDLVFARGSIQIPHVFYIGNDSYLYHAEPGELIWNQEPLNDLSSEWPSAMADPLGSFHVAYDVGGSSIHYITDMMGSWQDETVFDQLIPEGGNERPSLDMEVVWGSYLGIGNPHVVWMHADAEWMYDIWYSGKHDETWNQSVVTETPEVDEWPGYGPYFALDFEGYGHLTFAREDDEFVTQIFYAKSAEPLIKVAVKENSPQSARIDLAVNRSGICFNLPVSGKVTLNLYDASGRMIECIMSRLYPAGEHTVPISTADLSSGVYFARSIFGEYSASAKFIVTK